MDAGARGYLTKPGDFADLTESVARLLREATGDIQVAIRDNCLALSRAGDIQLVAIFRDGSARQFNAVFPKDLCYLVIGERRWRPRPVNSHVPFGRQTQIQ